MTMNRLMDAVVTIGGEVSNWRREAVAEAVMADAEAYLARGLEVPWDAMIRRALDESYPASWDEVVDLIDAENTELSRRQQAAEDAALDNFSPRYEDEVEYMEELAEQDAEWRREMAARDVQF